MVDLSHRFRKANVKQSTFYAPPHTPMVQVTRPVVDHRLALALLGLHAWILSTIAQYDRSAGVGACSFAEKVDEFCLAVVRTSNQTPFLDCEGSGVLAMHLSVETKPDEILVLRARVACKKLSTSGMSFLVL